MPAGINAEAINDRAKLLTHRLIARRLPADPEMISRAKAILRNWRGQGRCYTYLDEWEAILELDLSRVRQLITSRSETMTRLRASSPLGLASGLFTADDGLRRRIFRKAKRGAMLRS